MSRSHFALAIALFVIAATLAFVKTFPEAPDSGEVARPDRIGQQSGKPAGSLMEGARPTKLRASRPASASAFEIGFPQAVLESLTSEQRRKALSLAAAAEADTRTTLAELTGKYGLTRQQQRDIFPIVAAHTGSVHPSMTIDGIPVIPARSGGSLEEEIHGLLDPEQQATLADTLIDDIRWWEEIASQLEADLDNAIDNGEVDAGIPSGPAAVDPAPADGHGEAASRSGGGIFDLLHQGN